MHCFFPQISSFKHFSRPAVAHLLIIQFLHRRLLFQNQTVMGLECPSVLPLLYHGWNTPKREIWEKILKIIAAEGPNSFKNIGNEDFYTFFMFGKAPGLTGLEWDIDTNFFLKSKLRHCRLLIPWKGRTNGNKWPHFTIQSAVGRKYWKTSLDCTL